MNKIANIIANTPQGELPLLSLELADRKKNGGRLTPWDFVASVPNEAHRDMITLKLKGATLKEIGDMYDITRERVRQIIMKHINKKQITLEEDIYAEVYRAYAFTKEDFMLAFDLNDISYAYIAIACNKAGLNPMAQFLEDTRFSEDLRERAKRAVYKDYFTIGSTHILKRRTELASYVVRTYFHEEARFDDFMRKYNEVAKELNISDDKLFIVNPASYQNRLADAYNVLWKYQNRFRYYNILSQDFTPLLEGLDLERYTDVEYSSCKFFRLYPDLMKEFDIRDEYELHNLLKKLYAKKSGCDISFRRMPMIEFGHVDRNKQVYDLLTRLAPIGVRDFCEAYEAEYGVLTKTVMANFISCIDKYKRLDGIYDISPKLLTEGQFLRMKELLQDDFYDISYIEQRYRLEFPNHDPGAINTYTLKSMGFKVFNAYVVRNNYSSATDYFRHIMMSNDIVDTRKFSPFLTSQISFTGEIYNLKSRYEIIECKPMQYISISALEKKGITISDLKDYCDCVAGFVAPCSCFTIHSIKRQGFTHKLHKLLFDDWFFASILAEDKKRFHYQRARQTRLLYMSDTHMTTEQLYRNLIRERNGIGIRDFVKFLDEEYGIKTDKGKISELINASSMYYDRVSQKIYIEYQG